MPRPTLPGQDPAGLSCEWPAGSEQRRGRCPAADLLRCRPTSEAALDGARFILRRQEAAKQKATDAPLRSLAKALVAGDSGTEIASFDGEGERSRCSLAVDESRPPVAVPRRS